MESNSQHHIVDKILGNLKGYRPRAAKPDWDSFFDKHKSDIDIPVEKEHKTGLAQMLSSGRGRIVLLSAGIAVLIFSGIYFFSDFSSSREVRNETPSGHVQEQVEMTKTEVVPESSGEINNKVQPSGDVVQGQTIIETTVDQKIQVNQTPENTFIQETVKPPVSTGNAVNAQTPVIDEPPAKDNTVPNQPVVIKKKVIVKDTVRIVKKIKKDPSNRKK
jgi:hypothetical protein